MLVTFKYRLFPSKSQERLLNRTLETCRRWYNICLAERKDAWSTEKRSISKYEQMAKGIVANAVWVAIDIIRFWIIDRRERRGKR